MNDERMQAEVGASTPASVVPPPRETDASPAASARGGDLDHPYIWCCECGEVYWTPEELLDAYNKAVDDLNRHVPPDEYMPPAMHLANADEVTFCQECLHDF